MYKEKSILGLIPARGGSKTLPAKNIKMLCGKPLLAWTIEQGLASRLLDRVIVSTDDEVIAEVSRQHGAPPPFMRPQDLATDEAKTIDAVIHALDWFRHYEGREFDYLALLEPTSPLRAKDDIDESVRRLIDNEGIADCLVSVGEIALEHPDIAKRIDVHGYVAPYIQQEKLATRRQELARAYFPYGVIYLSRVDTLVASRSFYQERNLPFFIQRWQNYEVDDFYDFMIIETILKHKLEAEI